MKDIFKPTTCLSSEEIKLYLTEQFNEQDQYKVENHLLDCELCSHAVEGFANHYNFENDAQLGQLEEHYQAKAVTANIHIKKASRFNLWKINRLVAASLLIILIVASFLYWNSNTEERLFQAFYTPFEYEDLSTVRSEGASTQQPAELKEIQDFYYNKEYQRSIFVANQFLETKPENTIAHFYVGLAYLEEEQFGEATDHLSIVRLNNPQYYEDATWYLIMTMLRKGDYGQAKLLLAELLKLKDGFYEKKAKKLQGQLLEK